MTREEHISNLKTIGCDGWTVTTDAYKSLQFAIKVLEQEPNLDKIRAEIDGLTYYWCEVNPRSVIDDVLKIIDKYKAESEDKE